MLDDLVNFLQTSWKFLVAFASVSLGLFVVWVLLAEAGINVRELFSDSLVPPQR